MKRDKRPFAALPLLDARLLRLRQVLVPSHKRIPIPPAVILSANAEHTWPVTVANPTAIA